MGASIIAAVAALFKEFGQNLPLIAVWLANLKGKSQGRAEQQAAQDSVNAKAQETYAKVEAERSASDEWLEN